MTSNSRLAVEIYESAFKVTTLIEKIRMTIYFENLTKFGYKFGCSLKL